MFLIFNKAIWKIKLIGLLHKCRIDLMTVADILKINQVFLMQIAFITNFPQIKFKVKVITKDQIFIYPKQCLVFYLKDNN